MGPVVNVPAVFAEDSIPGVNIPAGFLLILVGVGAVLLLYHFLPRCLFRTVLRCGGLFLIFLVLIALFRILSDGRGSPFPVWLFCFLLLCALTYVFIWGLTRWFGSPRPRARPVTCPPVSLLKDLLAERLPHRDHVRLAAHLEVCTACQHRVEGLTAAQGAWTGMARKLNQPSPPPAPALKQVIESLKGNQEQEVTSDQPVFSADLPLGFLSPSDKPGQLGRLERYEVLAEIGRGGMGIVLKAFDPSLHRVVAIKVLAPQLATSGVARKRFLREAKAAAAVTHDHIVTIHAVDEANGLPYLVMQYVAGLSLQDRIDKEGPINELAEILRIGMQTASALSAAHNHGIVHRDIKPANILLEEGVQRVKITDFGLARAMDDASMTQSGFVAGSPLYMAPEQARGEALDHRADLFSLGSVLYTVCTGRPPFRAANTLAVLRRVCEDAPRPIRETNPEVPDWLAAIVDKLHAKDPADRFQSAAEVVDVLGQHLAQFQHAAWMPSPTSSPSPGGANTDAGLPTSMTICPSCGVNLHVPEKLVGSLVHCAECGKPFRVEDGSEVIQVARAAPPAFGQRAGAKKKIPSWYVFLIAGATLLGVMILLALLSHASSEMASQAAPPKSAAMPSENMLWGASPFGEMRGMSTVAVPFWKSSLVWFPAEATLFGAVDLKAFGTLKLDDEWTRTVLGLVFSAKANNMLTSENLGRIRIDGVSLAYYAERKAENSRGIVQLEGLALDGRKRIIDFIREAAPEKVQVEQDKKSPTGKAIRLSSPELPFALGLFDDHRAFLARSMNPDSTQSHHRKVLERLNGFDFSHEQRPSGDLLSGYHPPWLRTALAEIPTDACALLLGEIPIQWSKLLTAGLGLRTCPRTFVCYLKRAGTGVTLSLSLNLEKAGAEQMLLEDLETWRRKGIDTLQARFPEMRKEPAALQLLGQTLKTMQWKATAVSGSVGTQVRISGATGKAMAKLLKRASPSR